MKTKIIQIKEEQIDQEAIREAGNILRAGGLVAFPTETVYGLGGDALNETSSARIYAAKGRPSDNPLIVHITNMGALPRIAKEIPEEAFLLAEQYWPGPLTMIFRKTGEVPGATTGGLDTVAVRMPSHPIARALIDAAGGYVAAPSANRSGRPSPTEAAHVIEDLEDRVDMIIDGGPVAIGLESTIIDLSEGKPTILRPGYITEEMLGRTIGRVETDRALIDQNSHTAPRAPGMKYRHYAPKGNLTIVEGKEAEVLSYINKEIKKARQQGFKTGVIATDETAAGYLGDVVLSAGRRQDEEAVARQLFRILREFDEEEVQVMFAESFEEKGFGQAIMNRLLKAAGHQVIQLEK